MIMVTVFYISTTHIFEAARIFKAITARHLRLSPLRNAYLLGTWVHVVGLKKEVAEPNKIMKLSFFILITI